MTQIYAMLSVSPESVVFQSVYMVAETFLDFDQNKDKMTDEMKRPVLEAVIARLQEELDKLP